MIDLEFFSSPIGLGHATRDIAIAEKIRDHTFKFVSGSGASKIIENSKFNVESIYNPPNFIVENGSLKNPARWLWNYFQYYKECKKISNRVIQNDNPNLIVSDEDFASLTVGQEKKIPTVLITDILETHFVKGFSSFIEKKMNKSMQSIIQKCDMVIIPETGDDEGNIKRVGPIVRQTQSTREELRNKLSFEKKTILISIGGTDAGLFLIEKTLSIIPKLKQDVDVVVVSGPSVSKKFGKNIRNFGFVDNLHEVIFASDVLVSLAGKSTIDEAKTYGTPSIFIPIKGHFEQEDNARDEGYLFDDIFKLEELIAKKLEQKRKPLETNGATVASELIQKMI